MTPNCSWHGVSSLRILIFIHSTDTRYNTRQFSLAMVNLQGIQMGALFFLFSPSAVCLCRFFWFMEPTESVLAPLLSSHFANLWLWIRNNGSSDQHLNTPFPLLLESKAVGQIWNSCQSLVISNSLQGKLESKHQIGRKMRSVNSGMALHCTVWSKRVGWGGCKGEQK